MKNSIVNRRSLLKAGFASLPLTALPQFRTHAQALEEMCRLHLTPRQAKGPFYPVSEQLDHDTDLTSVLGRERQAKGQIIFVRGKVTDSTSCLPLEGALVEIWQACDSGRYNHPNDTNPAPLDPDFQYFGRAVTKADGRYIFKTILPGAYPATEKWIRPPHIHFRVLKKSYVELITQMYFAGDALNDVDEILQSLPKEEHASVVVAAKPADPEQFGPNARLCDFDLNLARVRTRSQGGTR